MDRKTCILLLKLYFLLALYSSIVVGAQRDTDIVDSWNSSQGRMQEFWKGGRWWLGTKEAPPWFGATWQKVLKIRPPRLAKNSLVQCYIKIVQITLKREENTTKIFENKWSISNLKTFKLQRILQQHSSWIFRCISTNNFFSVKFKISMDVHQDRCVELVFSHTVMKVRLYVTQWWIFSFSYSFADSWKLPIPVCDWLIFCCENLRLYQKKKK